MLARRLPINTKTKLDLTKLFINFFHQGMLGKPVCNCH